jgi:hypothetical protein
VRHGAQRGEQRDDVADWRDIAVTTDEQDFSDELVAYLRQVLAVHTTTPEVGVCKVCVVPRCSDRIDAYDRLAAAGQLMTASPLWQPFVLGPRP